MPQQQHTTVWYPWLFEISNGELSMHAAGIPLYVIGGRSALHNAVEKNDITATNLLLDAVVSSGGDGMGQRYEL
jgi:hypothetical protein